VSSFLQLKLAATRPAPSRPRRCAFSPHPALHVPCGMRLLLLPRSLHSTAAMARAPVSGSAAAAGALLPLNPARDRLASPLVRLPLPAGRVFRGVSLRCYAAAAAVAEQHRIKVQNPIVEMDGASVSAPAFQSLLQGLALWMMIDLAALILTPTFQAMR
jgi:hypothetical protein